MHVVYIYSFLLTLTLNGFKMAHTRVMKNFATICRTRGYHVTVIRKYPLRGTNISEIDLYLHIFLILNETRGGA